jgi:uncharacterized protein
LPSEYNREVFGGEMLDACEFSSLEEANEILGLMMRHWNTIAGTLFNAEVYVPFLLEGEQGVAHGNDWARGFMRGMRMRHHGWAELVNDEGHGGWLIPMMMLYTTSTTKTQRCVPCRSPQRSSRTSSFTWRLGWWGRIGISGSTKKPSRAVHSRVSLGARPQGRAERSLSVRLGKKYKNCCGGATVN